MSEANVALIRSLYEAFARRDSAAVMAGIDPEVEVRQSTLLPWGGHYKGLEGLHQFFTKILANIDSRVDPDFFVDAGDSVVAVGHTRGKILASGKPFDIPAVHVWKIRDGKVVAFEPYIDTPGMLKALQK